MPSRYQDPRNRSHDTQPTVESSLTWTLVVSGRLIRTLAEGMLDNLGAQALAVLYRLSEQDGVSQAELSRRQRVEAPTMCRMIDRLEREQLVARERDPLDRRSVRVMLTEKGRTLTEQRLATVQDIEQRAFATLNEEERETLHELLGRVLHSLPGPGDDRRSGRRPDPAADT
jgi:DNA-binding MarR family transcriptional regulator